MVNVALAHKLAGVGYVLGIAIDRHMCHVLILQF